MRCASPPTCGTTPTTSTRWSMPCGTCRARWPDTRPAGSAQLGRQAWRLVHVGPVVQLVLGSGAAHVGHHRQAPLRVAPREGALLGRQRIAGRARGGAFDDELEQGLALLVAHFHLVAPARRIDGLGLVAVAGEVAREV